MEEDAEIVHKGLGGKKIHLTTDEIMAQSMLFLLAGYETTATTLDFILYSLATNPQCQERCVEEILSVVPPGVSVPHHPSSSLSITKMVFAFKKAVTYEDVHRMPYLESVICETLRLYPPIRSVSLPLLLFSLDLHYEQRIYMCLLHVLDWNELA